MRSNSEEEVAVRYIPTSYHTKMGWAGNKPALCFINSKEKNAHCVISDELEIRTVDIPIDVIVSSREVTYMGVSYPVNRFVERLLSSRKPLSEESSRLLSRIDSRVETVQPVAEGTTFSFAMEDPESNSSIEKRVRKGGGGGPTLISKLADEFGLPQPKLRRFLRDKGLRAPYTDESKIREILKKLPKEKANGKK